MTLRSLRVFISSPGDVAEERVIARRVIGRLDAQFGELIQVEAVFWEHLPLAATASFQEQLQKPSDTDVAIVILWSRLGTVLPSTLRREDGSTFASGTEYEFEDAVAGFRRTGRPHLLAYRKTAPTPTPSDLAALEEAVAQKQAMERFVDRWFRKGDGSFKAAFHNFAAPADFEDLLEAHLAKLVETYLPAGASARSSTPTWRGSSPFRGLEVFEPQHAAVFFGRTAAVASVLSRLRSQGLAQKAFVLIVSMSGGGKSSLVRAGVLPLMMQPGVVGTATAWRHAVVRPSDGLGDPLQALARAIVDATVPDGGSAAAVSSLAEAPDTIAARTIVRLDAIDAGPTGSGCHLVLVVDQLEEAFSDERIDDAARAAFFAAIDALARSGRVWIVATVRSDAYPRVVEQPLLLALKEGDGQFDLVPPNLREIGQIIRFPAAAAGLRFEFRASTAERLDDVIRDAAARNPGALPLLQFLLEELYKRRNAENVLTFRAYEELGGVEGALAQRAEAVLAEVGEQARNALPVVLRELVTFGNDDETKALRRITPRSAFESAAAIALVDALIEARLLVSTLDAAGESVISLAHEALLEFWPRLRAWRDADRELLLVHARLDAAARAWEKNARSGDLLLARGKPLAEARALVSAAVRLTPSEAALVDASTRRARRFAQLQAGAITVLGLLTVVAGAAAYRATVESRRAQVQATTAQRTTDFMVSLFASADPDQNQGQKVTVQEVLDRGVTQIDSELKDEDSVKANLLRAMGESYNGLGLYKKARGVLESAQVEALRGGVATDGLKVRMALADNLFQDGDYVNAEAAYRRSVSDARAIHGAEHVAVAQAMIGIGESLFEQNKSAEAEQEYRDALAMMLRLGAGQTVDAARVLDDLGRLLVASARFGEAEPSYIRALDIEKSLFGSKHSSVARSLNNLASLYFQTGQYDKAKAAFSEALPVYRSVFGNHHRRVAVVLNNLGRLELMSNQLALAESHLSESVAINREVLTPGHDQFIVALNNMAMVLMATGRAPLARPLLDEALQIARSRNHWMLSQVLDNEAELGLLLPTVPDGRASLAEARDVLSKRYGDKLNTTDAWRSAIVDITEAGYRLDHQESSEAQHLLLKALPVLEKQFGTRNLFVDRTLARLALAYERSGEVERSNAYRARLAAADP